MARICLHACLHSLISLFFFVRQEECIYARTSDLGYPGIECDSWPKWLLAGRIGPRSYRRCLGRLDNNAPSGQSPSETGLHFISVNIWGPGRLDVHDRWNRAMRLRFSFWPPGSKLPGSTRILQLSNHNCTTRTGSLYCTYLRCNNPVILPKDVECCSYTSSLRIRPSPVSIQICTIHANSVLARYFTTVCRLISTLRLLYDSMKIYCYK